MVWRSLCAVGLVLILFISSAEAQTKRDLFEGWLRENREKFPLISLKRDQIPFASIHTLPTGQSELKYNERFFTGFRFSTPEWSDGPMQWMFSIPGAEEQSEGLQWFIVPEKQTEEELHLARVRYTKNLFPKFQKLFPDCESFYQQWIQKEELEASAIYIVYFSFPRETMPEIRFSVTIDSERGLGEYGMLPTGYPEDGPGLAFKKSPELKAKPASEVVEAAVKVFRESGTAKALAYLDDELKKQVDAGGKFYELFLAIWREAQVGSGRTEPEWAADLNLWLQKRSIEWDATFCADQLSSNASATLMSVHRYGAARESLGPFFKEMARRKISTDPSSFPDAGPAFEALPEVRLRDVPFSSSLSILRVTPSGFVSYRKIMPPSFGGAMRSLARMELMGGDWKKSIERNLWVTSWAEEKRPEVFEAEGQWYSSRSAIADAFETLDLLELADSEYEKILKFEWPDIYQNRTKMEARRERIRLRIDLAGADPAMLDELAEIYTATKENGLVYQSAWENVELTRAKCLAALNRQAEADEIVTRLAGAGNHSARLMRLANRIRANELDQVESELIELLAQTRKWGDKMGEIALYSQYAEFLTLANRLPEALQMRREAISLIRSFDLFAKLPVEIARLSVLLTKCGDPNGSAAAAEEAAALAGKSERIPARISKQVTSILAERARITAPNLKSEIILSDLQPLNSVVVPVKGKALRNRLTLTNPSSQTIEGTLAFSGIPVSAVWNPDVGEAEVVLGKQGIERLEKVRLEPGSFAVIDLFAAADEIGNGSLKTQWMTPGQKDQESICTIDPAESGVSSAVIDAGEFKRNSFYGVPIYHHFQSASDSTKLAPLRVVCSVPARVEFYDSENRLVYIDAKGDGEFGESGDSVFQDGNSDGNPDVALDSGETQIRLQVYPSANLPKEGITVVLESLFEGKWVPFAEDRIKP